jgi:hypothetical protein
MPTAEDQPNASGDRARRWYHVRPDPRRRTDLMGIGVTWWLTLLIVIVLVAVL